MTASQSVKQELESLIKLGKEIKNHSWRLEAVKELKRRGKKLEKDIQVDYPIAAQYQKWYSQSLLVIHQLLPDRYTEFQEYYRLDKRKGLDASTYTVSDYLMGFTVTMAGEEVFSSSGAFLSKLECQINILESALTRIDSILTNIKGVLQAELFDDELLVANELYKKKLYRPAGAIAGVIIERHLGQIVIAHSLAIRKKDPSISDLNDILKNEGVIDLPNWRFIQRLGDIRNLCVHFKERDPKPEEVEDLIRGAEKLIKTLF